MEGSSCWMQEAELGSRITLRRWLGECAWLMESVGGRRSVHSFEFRVSSFKSKSKSRQRHCPSAPLHPITLRMLGTPACAPVGVTGLGSADILQSDRDPSLRSG